MAGVRPKRAPTDHCTRGPLPLARLGCVAAVYYPLSEPVLSAVSGRTLAVVASLILGIGVWHLRLRVYGITTAFTFWFALTGADHAGYLLVRTALDGDPFPLGDFAVHLLVAISLGLALVLVLRHRALPG